VRFGIEIARERHGAVATLSGCVAPRVSSTTRARSSASASRAAA
jgi:hypothetical protein